MFWGWTREALAADDDRPRAGELLWVAGRSAASVTSVADRLPVTDEEWLAYEVE